MLLGGCVQGKNALLNLLTPGFLSLSTEQVHSFRNAGPGREKRCVYGR